MLISGYYVQKNNPENGFSTNKAANDLLKEQGIKVGNPSQAIATNKSAKRVFALQQGKFRVSQPGVDHINSLRNS